MKKINVTIWHEYRHEKIEEKVRALYPEGIHAFIKGFLDKNEDMNVRIASLDDPEQEVKEVIASIAANCGLKPTLEDTDAYLAAELPLEGEKSIRVFFERQSMTPFYMEATENGRCVVFCNIKNWTMGDT